MRQVQLPSPTPMMRLVWRRISMTLIRMRSGIAVNIMMLKRVRFICGRDIITRRLDGLFRGTWKYGIYGDHGFL